MNVEPPIRGQDVHGEGYYGAPRGSRTHNGVDMACCPDSLIKATRRGKVTKIGYPYNPEDAKKGFLRYVQVTDVDGFDHRYFYVRPKVRVGDEVEVDGVIGKAQDMDQIYPGITPHIHYEVKLFGSFVDPRRFL